MTLKSYPRFPGELSRNLYGELPGISDHINDSAVYFAMYRDQSHIVELLLEHNLTEHVSLRELIQACLSIEAKNSLAVILSKVPTDVDVLRQILLTACNLNPSFIDTLVKHGAMFDQEYLKSNPSVLYMMYTLRDVKDTCCSLVTSLVLQEASKEQVTSLVSYSTLMALIGRMTQQKDASTSVEEHRLFDVDIQACLTLLVESNPSLVTESTRTVAESISAINSSIFRNVHFRTKDMRYFIRFIIRLLELGFPAQCHVEDSSACALQQLVSCFFHSRQDNSANDGFLFLLKILLNSGCDPNYCSSTSMYDFFIPHLTWISCPYSLQIVWHQNFTDIAAYLNLMTTCLSMMRHVGLQLDRKTSGKFLIHHLLELVDKRLNDSTNIRPIIHMCAVAMTESDFIRDEEEQNLRYQIKNIQTKVLKLVNINVRNVYAYLDPNILHLVSFLVSLMDQHDRNRLVHPVWNIPEWTEKLETLHLKSARKHITDIDNQLSDCLSLKQTCAIHIRRLIQGNLEEERRRQLDQRVNSNTHRMKSGMEAPKDVQIQTGVDELSKLVHCTSDLIADDQWTPKELLRLRNPISETILDQLHVPRTIYGHISGLVALETFVIDLWTPYFDE